MQLFASTSQYMDEYECGWEKGFTTHAVRDRHSNLVCLYRKNSFPYNIKGGVKV